MRGSTAAAAKKPWPGRPFTVGCCYVNFFIGGTFYGLSPLVLPVSAAFADGEEYAGGVFFYGFAILMVAFNVSIVFACFWSRTLPFKQRQHFVMSGLVAWPLGLAVLAASVQLRAAAPMFAVAFPLMGHAVAINMYLHLVETAMWWEERVNVGQAMTGGASGFGAFLWTWVFGEIIHALGESHVTLSLWIFFATHTIAIAAGLAFCNPAYHLKPVIAPRSADPGPASETSPAAQLEEDDERPDDLGMSLSELAKDWRVYVFVGVGECFYFAGLSMKTLLSVLFEEIFDMGYIDAVRYSSGCLSLYVVARFVSPLMATGNRVFLIFFVVLVMEAVAYSLTPWAVRLPGQAGTSLYTFFRVVGGVGFAVLVSNTTTLLVRIFGVQNVPRISGLFLGLDWICGLGPSVAFVLHVESIRRGGSSMDSWNPFFYLCATLAAAAALGVMSLRACGIRKVIIPPNEPVGHALQEQVLRPAAIGCSLREQGNVFESTPKSDALDPGPPEKRSWEPAAARRPQAGDAGSGGRLITCGILARMVPCS